MGPVLWHLRELRVKQGGSLEELIWGCDMRPESGARLSHAHCVQSLVVETVLKFTDPCRSPGSQQSLLFEPLARKLCPSKEGLGTWPRM